MSLLAKIIVPRFSLTLAKFILFVKIRNSAQKICWEATVKASGTLNFWRGNDKRLSEQWLAIRNDMLHEPLESPLQSTSFKSIIFLQEIILDKYDAKIVWFIRHWNYEKYRRLLTNYLYQAHNYSFNSRFVKNLRMV